jgi:hypothetical protein
LEMNKVKTEVKKESDGLHPSKGQAG